MTHSRFVIGVLLALSIVAAACGPVTPAASPTPDSTSLRLVGEAEPSPLPATADDQLSPLPTPTLASPSATAVSQLSPLPTPAAAATSTPQPGTAIPLIVLHTNDNWGETEPCG